MTDLIRVDPRYPGAWDALSGFLADALERGGGDKDWGIEDLREACQNGALALWAGVHDDVVFGAAVTTMTRYPKRSVLEVLAMGAKSGSEAQWALCLEQLKHMAREWGLSAIVGTGRPGWARKLGGTERKVFEIELEN